MPIAETTMIAAQVTSKRRALALRHHDTPERHGQPAEVLANDRSDQVSVVATLRPVKRNGSAFGIRRCRVTAIGPAA